ncbi:flagellar assembly protein FliH [Corallincola platygyrae]|uniref:Flagellar assembly protein FliH n=1 Tax=Corallincola platygyrae TaxID=1193278 RepID=A0ABW4XJ74_9GAMM
MANKNENEIDSWQLPDVGEEIDFDSIPTNAMGLRPGERHEIEVEEEEEIPVLTAEELELIRKAAYDEGLLQGHEEGHAKGFEEGKKEGFEQGHKEGLVKGQAEGEAAGAALVQERAEAWSALARQFEQPLMHVDGEVERSLVGLVVELAQEVIRCEIATNEEVILKVLREATNALPLSARKLSISLNPDDLALVERHYSEEMLSERGWQLSAEPSMNRGDCQISSEQSYVSVSLKERVKTLMERFLHQSVPALEPDTTPLPAQGTAPVTESPVSESAVTEAVAGVEQAEGLIEQLEQTNSPEPLQESAKPSGEDDASPEK